MKFMGTCIPRLTLTMGNNCISSVPHKFLLFTVLPRWTYSNFMILYKGIYTIIHVRQIDISELVLRAHDDNDGQNIHIWWFLSFLNISRSVRYFSLALDNIWCCFYKYKLHFIFCGTYGKIFTNWKYLHCSIPRSFFL